MLKKGCPHPSAPAGAWSNLGDATIPNAAIKLPDSLRLRSQQISCGSIDHVLTEGKKEPGPIAERNMFSCQQEAIPSAVEIHSRLAQVFPCIIGRFVPDHSGTHIERTKPAMHGAKGPIKVFKAKKKTFVEQSNFAYHFCFDQACTAGNK